MATIIGNRLEKLLKDKNKNENWIKLVEYMQTLENKNNLTFAQENLITQIIERLCRWKNIDDLEVRNLILLIGNSGIRLF